MPATFSSRSGQGPCKVGSGWPDLRLWRPAAGVEPPEPSLCLPPAWRALDPRPGESALAVRAPAKSRIWVVTAGKWF
jgi:hypothetical protein